MASSVQVAACRDWRPAWRDVRHCTSASFTLPGSQEVSDKYPSNNYSCTRIEKLLSWDSVGKRKVREYGIIFTL